MSLLESREREIEEFFGVPNGERRTVPPSSARASAVSFREPAAAMAAARFGEDAEPRFAGSREDSDLSWLEEDTQPMAAVPTWVPPR